MPNGTTTKVKTKTSTVVAILLAGGAIAAAAFIAGNRFSTPREQPVTRMPTDTSCAMTCAEALQRCPCPPCPTTPTVTPVPPTVELQKPSCVYGPDLVVTEIKPEMNRTAVTVQNVGTANIPSGTTVSVKLETATTVLGVVGTPTGLPEGTKVTLSLPVNPSGNTYLKATVDPNNVINESNYLTKSEIPDCFNGENNNTKDWQTIL